MSPILISHFTLEHQLTKERAYGEEADYNNLLYTIKLWSVLILLHFSFP